MPDCLEAAEQPLEMRLAALRERAVSRAARRLRDRALAEDVVQEALESALIHLPDLRDPGRVEAWFRAILDAACLMSWRRQAAERACLAEFLGETAPRDVCRSAEDEALAAEESALVHEALRQLPDSCRDIAMLRHAVGLTSRETARHLGLPEGTVKRRLRQARDILAHILTGPKKRVMRVAFLPISDHLLAMVAGEMAATRPERAETRRFLSWQALVAALRAGEVDAAFIMAPLAALLSSTGTPLIHVLDAHHDGSALTVDHVRRTAGQGRPLDDPDRPARLGLPCPVSTHAIFLKTLLDGPRRLFNGRVDVSYLAPSRVTRSLRERRIDAFFCAEPWNTAAVAKGLGATLLRTRDIMPGHVCCVLAARSDFAVAHGDLVRDYVRDLRRAAELVRRDSGRAADIQALRTGVDRAAALRVIETGAVTFDDLDPDQGRTEACLNLARVAGVLARDATLDSRQARSFA